MGSDKHFYAVIIGTEILNGRREDAHFDFLKKSLKAFGHTLFASLVIKDDKELIRQIFTLVKNDPHAVLFSFGGIGSTPDDLTRQIAAEVFTAQPLQRHKKFEQDIIERFGDEAYPHRVHMADLPRNCELLFNPVNNMSGFQLQDRYFFVPGFPQMSHPMIKEAIQNWYSEAMQLFTRTLTAHCSENELIHLMQKVPEDIELSSLPQLIDNKPKVVISVTGKNEMLIEKIFQTFSDYLKENKIPYLLGE